MKQATLCLLLKEDKILLAMKKRGFGVGKWNGVGGKIDATKDKDEFDAIIREAKEEIGVDLISPEKVGIIHFTFQQEKESWNQQVHVFLAKEWRGEPIESEEMKPQWFSVNEIPYTAMWADDKIWLPHFLQEKKFIAEFTFGSDNETIISQDLKIVEKL